MRLLDWLGLSNREDTTPPEGSVVTVPTREANVVNGDTALGIISVYRAIQIHAIAAMQLTLDVWRLDEPVVPAPSVVRRPDMRTSRSAWLAQNVTSMATTGNAYWRVERDSRHRPVNVPVLDPHLCTPLRDGRLAYKNEVLEAGEFQHLKVMERPGHLYGLGPIQACRAELTGALDLRDYAAEWFRSGEVPTGILKSDQQLTQDQADHYKALWEARGRGVAVMGAGLGYSPILLAPEDAQFLESRQFTKTEIATLFGIPAHMLLAAVEGSTLTYANMSQADLAYVRWSLMGYLKPIEDAMSLVLTGLQEARFNLDGVLRPDITTRYAAHKVALDAGWMDPDEVRKIEGLAPRTTPAPTPAPDQETTP